MGKSAKEYGRCSSCGKLTEKKHLKPGPHGGLLGPDCYRRSLNTVRSGT